MNELTMALDELESVVAQGGTGFSYRNARPELIHVTETLRANGGDFARLAFLIEELTVRNTGYTGDAGSVLRPGGNVTTPSCRSDVTTMTAGNGVMSGVAS